jgi:hypothetical protein
MPVAARRGRGRFHNPEIPGFTAALDLIEAFGGEAALQEFTNGGCAARHVFGEAPTVQSFQLFSGKHDLKALSARQITHCHFITPLLSIA